VLKIAKGFSLLELMIVVAIIGILVMIAYPSYQMHVMKSRRTEAKTGLLALAQAQEEYRADRNEYADSLTNLKEATQIRAERTFYSFSLSRPTPLTFTLTARPVGAQLDDTQCPVFTLDQAGQKTPPRDPGLPDCW
jgi:type IV pilus assembly protein PilE